MTADNTPGQLLSPGRLDQVQSPRKAVGPNDSAEQREIVRNLYGTLYEGKAFDEVPTFYSPDAVRHGGLRGSLEGREALRRYLQASLGGFSDIEVTEPHCPAEDDIVVYDFERAATRSGEVLAVPPTGKRIEITNAALFRIEDGNVTDELPRTDMLGLLQGIELVDLPF